MGSKTEVKYGTITLIGSQVSEVTSKSFLSLSVTWWPLQTIFKTQDEADIYARQSNVCGLGPKCGSHLCVSPRLWVHRAG